MTQGVILASGSKARADMLHAAGVSFRAVPTRIDEASVKAAMLTARAPARDIADTLAEMKAKRAADRNPGFLTLGADQVLLCDGTMIDKVADAAGAERTLRFLRGKTHELFSGAVIYENGNAVWRHIGRAKLEMRDFSDAFLQGYIRRSGDDILSSVGCYRLEGEGSQLFSRVDGDFFTILGLPLLEVLGFLRTRGIVEE